MSFAWLLFFPNTYYTITDFIHLSRNIYYIQENPYSGFIYTLDYTIYLALFHILIGVLISVMLGTYSLYMMHQIINQLVGKYKAYIILVVIFFLSSIGIYIGRFLRFNSWDIFLPHKIISGFFRSFTLFSLQFIILFTFIHIVVYFFIYSFIKTNEA